MKRSDAFGALLVLLNLSAGASVFLITDMTWLAAACLLLACAGAHDVGTSVTPRGMEVRR